MHIAMIGAGYVGLTTGACLASLGHTVTCIDSDRSRTQRLAQGELPIFEPGLDRLVAEARAAGRLSFSASSAAVSSVDAVFIAVGTPSGPDGEIDLSFVESAAAGVAPLLPEGATVVVKSTVVAGTAARLAAIIAGIRGRTDVAVASNPEFLREGSAVDDFMNPDRIVIGADDERSAQLLVELYAPLIARDIPTVVTTTENAELIKYAANAFLALKIGFVNEVADLCEKVGGDISAVARGVGLDRRIGGAFLSPGPGFGGSCFPKDTRAFAATGRRHGARQGLIETLIRRNERRKMALAERIIAHPDLGPGSAVAVLGLAFKANTDDVRESAALSIIPILQQAGLRIRAHDPQAARNAAAALDGVAIAATPEEACIGADAAVVLTEWDDYRALDLSRLGGLMRRRLLFDFRNVLSAAAAARAGFDYACLGRQPSDAGRLRTRTGGHHPAWRAVAEPAR